MRAPPADPDAQAEAHLGLMFAGYDQGLVEVAHAWRDGDGRLRMCNRQERENFLPVDDLPALVRRVGVHRARGHEVLVGAVPRTRPEARREAVGTSRVVWVDIDAPEHLERAVAFGRPSHIALASGSGGVHLYWRLARPLGGDELERACRRLAVHLGADEAATDRLRLLRCAGTTNGKVQRTARLLAVRPELAAYELEALLDGVAELPPPPAPRAARYGSHDDDALEQIAPPAYFATLAALEVPEGGGFVCCPVHQERTPSCQVFAEAARGWHCWGCGRGGSVYDLASALAGGPTGAQLRGEAFLEVKRRVRERLGAARAP